MSFWPRARRLLEQEPRSGEAWSAVRAGFVKSYRKDNDMVEKPEEEAEDTTTP